MLKEFQTTYKKAWQRGFKKRDFVLLRFKFFLSSMLFKSAVVVFSHGAYLTKK
jgi:hypothetical protein